MTNKSEPEYGWNKQATDSHNSSWLTRSLRDFSAQNQNAVELYPMDNFGIVVPGLYRSACPKKRNFDFISELALKSILILIPENCSEQNLNFMRENNVQFFQLGVVGNKEPISDIPEDVICKALSIVLDRRNYPLLIHCNKGKHRTGCLVGCLRKIQCWTYTAIFEEYRRFAQLKSRSTDLEFIELFDTSRITYDKNWLPEWFWFNES